MILKRVRYQNFRNIASEDISFSPGINLFCGDNAQGKTNALEGIYLFAQGRSHRTAKEKDYITYEQDFAKVILDYENKQRENQLELRYLRSGRKFCRKNGLALRKMSEFIGNSNAVIFCPEYHIFSFFHHVFITFAGYIFLRTKWCIKHTPPRKYSSNIPRLV